MAKLDFGGVQETVVTRSEFTLAKAQETEDYFAKAFEESWAIDPIMSRMIATGERTSEIPKLLESLSKFYSEISADSIARTKAVLQPVLMLMVYVVVGSLLIAIMLPELTVGSQALG